MPRFHAPSNSAVPQGREDIAQAHQPNARYAPAAILSGTLFTRHTIDSLYDRVAAPVLVLHDVDRYSSFNELAPFASGKDSWSVQRIPNTRGLSHFDESQSTKHAIEAFVARIEG